MCGYEKVFGLPDYGSLPTDDRSLIDAAEGGGVIYSNEEKSLNTFFERGLNSSSCPIVGYELSDIDGNPLEEHAQKDFFIEGFKLAVNSSLDPL